MKHNDDFERRFWCRVVKRCVPRLGMSAAVEAADLVILALRERSVASAVHPATGSAYERLVSEYRTLEKLNEGLLTERAIVLHEREAQKARLLELDQQAGEVRTVLGVWAERPGPLPAQVSALRTAYREVESALAEERQKVAEARAELASLRVDVERLRLAVGNSSVNSKKKDR